MVETVKTRRTYNGALRKEQAQVTRRRILDAARRVLVSGTYSSVTMDDIAKEAGVAYQTVYGIFGSKLRLAQGLLEVGFPHIENALKQIDADVHADPLRHTNDPELGLRTSARASRVIYEQCADLLRFMRESGDPGLLALYREGEERRLKSMIQLGLPKMLERSGRLRAGISASEAVAVIWSLSGPDQYTQLVFERGWAPSRYEGWLGDATISMLLNPRSRRRA